MPSRFTCWIVSEKLTNDDYVEVISNSLSGNLLVKTLTGKTIELDYDGSYSIDRVKELI